MTTTAARERKKTIFYNEISLSQNKLSLSSFEKSSLISSISSGAGIKLGDYSHFNKELEKHKGDSEVCKALHSLLYNTPGKKHEVKKNLRLFSGWKNSDKSTNVDVEQKQQKQPEDEENDFKNNANSNKNENDFIDVDEKKIIDEKKEKIRNKKKLWTISLLKLTCHLFGLQKSGDRENLICKLINYLYQPTIIIKENSSNSNGSNKKRKLSTKNDKNKKNKKGKKDKGEKNPPNAYILFSSDRRKQIRIENPLLKVTEIMGLLASKWKELNNEDKEVYVQKAKELKAQFLARKNVTEASNDIDFGDDDGEEDDDDDNDDDNNNNNNNNNDGNDNDDDDYDDGAESDDFKDDDVNNDDKNSNSNDDEN